MRRPALPLAALALAACDPRRDVREERGGADTLAAPAEGVAVGAAASAADARFVANLVGFNDPESVRYDPEQDAFLVSNMTGYGSVKDGNGYITRVSAAPPYAATVLARGDSASVVLHAPKGMAIHGDTLWVADIDALRGFERRTGAPLATIDFSARGAVMLNDVAVAPDGTLRVTDTGIVMSPKGIVHTGPDRIFTVGPGGAISVMAEGLELRQPNGVAWDSAGGRWVVVSFDNFVGQVAAFPRAGGARQVLHQSKLGRFDGVEVLPNGTILYTSWADSSVHALAGGRDRRVVREVQGAADLGVDTRRGVLAIPLATLGRVQLWRLGENVTGTPPR
jgi:sugar lactone lactonase YvrE